MKFNLVKSSNHKSYNKFVSNSCFDFLFRCWFFYFQAVFSLPYRFVILSSRNIREVNIFIAVFRYMRFASREIIAEQKVELF